MTDNRSFVTGDGCRIAYRIDGAEDRPVLAFSNSIATDLHMWDSSVAQLGGAFRLLRYDTRGHGGSDAPSGGYSLDRLGRDVVALLDHLAIERVNFLGLSLGGLVGQWLGVHAAERIDRLILSNTSPWLADELPFDAQIDTVLAASDSDAIAEGFMQNWFPADWLTGPNANVARFRAMAAATSRTGLAGCYAALRDVDFRKTNALITRPTLVIGGEHDGVTLPSHSRQIADTIPNGELLILPGVHLLNVELPEPFHHAVRGFLRTS